MSDGPGDCAANSHRQALDWVEANWPGIKNIPCPLHVKYKDGLCISIFEGDRLEHIVERYYRGKVVKRLSFEPYFCGKNKNPTELSITDARPGGEWWDWLRH